MGGVTVAPQPTKNDSDAFLASFNANPTSSLDTRSDMESLLPSRGWPMEDLTGEVHELMLRESMNWLPWMEDTNLNHSVKTGSPMESLDSQLLAQTLQLDGLFGQELNFDLFDQVGSSLLYDEFTFDSSPVSTPVPSQDQQPHEEQHLQHHVLPVTDEHSSSPTTQVLPCEDKIMDTTTEERDDSSTDDDGDDDSEEDDSDDEQQGGPVSMLTSTYMYLPKRQMEEALLNKITHHLQPDKLPGILSIVSSSIDDDDDQVNDEEVEIDLSSLVREQLVRVMLYVDACIAEQQGGSVVKLDHYLVGDNNKAIKAKTRTTRATNETNDGPMSMAALTKKSRSASRKQQAIAKKSLPPKRRRTRRKPDQGMVLTRPTRRAALHKRRMLEDTLLIPSDNDDDANDGMDQQVMVTYGEEQMDFKVVENQTIVHQPLVASSSSGGGDGDLCIEANMDDDDDDEDEIDIM